MYQSDERKQISKADLLRLLVNALADGGVYMEWLLYQSVNSWADEDYTTAAIEALVEEMAERGIESDFDIEQANENGGEDA